MPCRCTALLVWRVHGNGSFDLKPEQNALLVELAHETGKPLPALIAEALDDEAFVGDRCRLVLRTCPGRRGSPARDMREGKFPGVIAGEPSLHWTWCVGPALRSARRCDSLEEGDNGFCK